MVLSIFHMLTWNLYIFSENSIYVDYVIIGLFVTIEFWELY